VLIGNWYENLEASRQGDCTAATLMGYGGRFAATTTSRATFTAVSSGPHAPLTVLQRCNCNRQPVAIVHRMPVQSRQPFHRWEVRSTPGGNSSICRSIPWGLPLHSAGILIPWRSRRGSGMPATEPHLLEQVNIDLQICRPATLWFPSAFIDVLGPLCLLLQGRPVGSSKQSTGSAESCVPPQLKFSHGDPAAPPVQCFATMNQLALGGCPPSPQHQAVCNISSAALKQLACTSLLCGNWSRRQCRRTGWNCLALMVCRHKYCWCRPWENHNNLDAWNQA
jgi:hypothetical protein